MKNINTKLLAIENKKAGNVDERIFVTFVRKTQQQHPEKIFNMLSISGV